MHWYCHLLDIFVFIPLVFHSCSSRVYVVFRYRESCKEEPESNSLKQKKPAQSQGPNRNICKCLAWVGVHTLKRGILAFFKSQQIYRISLAEGLFTLTNSTSTANICRACHLHVFASATIVAQEQHSHLESFPPTRKWKAIRRMLYLPSKRQVCGKFRRVSGDQHLQHILQATAHFSHDPVANETWS